MPFLRGKTFHFLAGLQHLANRYASFQAIRSRRTRGNTEPVPVNDIFGPCLMYRDFSDALKHPKIHPRTKLADNLSLFVRGPLRVRAPVLPGEVNPLNSAPPLWGGICADNMHPLRLRPRRPVIAIRGRPRASFALYLAAGQAKERTINDSTPQPAQWQKQPCHASKKNPSGLSAGSFHLHRSAGHAHRQASIQRNAAETAAFDLTSFSHASAQLYTNSNVA